MKKIDAVVFDVDSTLVGIEGLDWLASVKGKNRKLKLLTKKSMDGLIDFNSAMREKMRIISPSYSDLEKLGEVYCQNVVHGVQKTIAILKKLNIEVWILTGNFPPAVTILGKYLGVEKEKIISNKIFFKPNGEYQDFDSNGPLSKNGGKAQMVDLVKNGNGKSVVCVGDGITDLEIKSKVALFVGFGGVVERVKVKENSDFYISEPSLESLPQVLGLM